MSMLKKMSKRRNSAQLTHANVAMAGVVIGGNGLSSQSEREDRHDSADGLSTSTTTAVSAVSHLVSARTSDHRSELAYVDAQTPPASPKPGLLKATSATPMSRDEKIMMLLAKAAPSNARPDNDGALARSLTLPRGSSYSGPKSRSFIAEAATTHHTPPGSPRTVSDQNLPADSPRKKLERTTSGNTGGKTAAARPASTTLTLITTAITALTPRAGAGEGKRRSASFSGTSIAQRSRGTVTRIIYYASPMAVLTAPQYYLVPNEVMTEGMHAALAQAHACEFGTGTSESGENEVELKMSAILLLDKDVNPRRRMAMQSKALHVGQPGMLAEYLQQGVPETCIAKTAITDEYIFKNFV